MRFMCCNLQCFGLVVAFVFVACAAADEPDKPNVFASRRAGDSPPAHLLPVKEPPPSLVADGIALVGQENTVWYEPADLFLTAFRLADDDPRKSAEAVKG